MTPMNKTLWATLLLPLCLLFSACGGRRTAEPPAATEANADTAALSITPCYAEGFTVSMRPDSIYLVVITEPANKHAVPQHFALVPRSHSLPADLPEGYEVIRTPVERAICMTMPQLSCFTAAGAFDKVVGVSSTRRLQNSEWRTRIADGRVKKIGIEGEFDTEVVLAAQPEIIFVSPNRRGGYEMLKEMDFPLVQHWAFKETSPLGLSEWMKLVGLFCGFEQEACREFAAIEQRYNGLKALTAHVARRPTVFSGEMWGSGWYVPGGKSFYARLFEDAGADYFYKEDLSTGGVIVDFETVYAKAANMEFWRVMNSYKGIFTYRALQELNSRYADFRAFKEKKVIYCNLNDKPLYENMPLAPDVLLLDMIKAFHPELMLQHNPVYYELLKE